MRGDTQSALLIAEIDKADIDFPNDLLPAFHPSELLSATCVDKPDEISVMEFGEEAMINS